jgi:predicted LPLAT superfamily acyltransferase
MARIDDRSGGLFDQLVADGLGMGHGPGRGTILVGLHFGALEFPSYVLEQRGLRMTAPMEVIDNPPLQAYFMRTRSHKGLRLIPQEGSRAELIAALERGDAVGLVSDRVVRGRGAAASLFGHPTRLPVAAPLLSLETGASINVAAVWRLGGGRYAGSVVRLEVPPAGERGERIRGYLGAQAAAFESFIAEAPEQWWAIFFPIWPDLEEPRRSNGGRSSSRSGLTSKCRRARPTHDDTSREGRPAPPLGRVRRHRDRRRDPPLHGGTH